MEKSYNEVICGEDFCESHILEKADESTVTLLENKGYQIVEQETLDDCIAYKTVRNGDVYAVYLFAYGKEKKVFIDGNYCEKLLKHRYSMGAVSLVLYVQIRQTQTTDSAEYEYLDYCGGKDNFDFWKISYIDSRPSLIFFPNKEIEELIYKFVSAFNCENYPALKFLLEKLNASFIGIGDSGYHFNDACFYCIERLHRQYGDMKIGYVRFNDVIYSKVPYIDGYGYFGFHVSENTKIQGIYADTFEGTERKVIEFIKTDDSINDNFFKDIPDIISAEPLSGSVEKLALKINFSNGECKKYVLPVNEERYAYIGVVRYDFHVFSSGIWESVCVKDNVMEKGSCLGQSLCFKNGYTISKIECYLNSQPYFG